MCGGVLMDQDSGHRFETMLVVRPDNKFEKLLGYQTLLVLPRF